MDQSPPRPVDLVRLFLRAQNLEQLGRPDEAVELYEQCVAHRFDSSGPYDRLVALYGHQSRHDDVVRVIEAALVNVQTHAEKRAWFDRMRTDALRASQNVPRATPKKRAP